LLVPRLYFLRKSYESKENVGRWDLFYVQLSSWLFFFVVWALFIFTYKNLYEAFYSVASYTKAAWFCFFICVYELWCACNIGAWANEEVDTVEGDEGLKEPLLVEDKKQS